MAPLATTVKPCKISLPVKYIMYDGRTSQAPLIEISFSHYTVHACSLGDDPEEN